MTRRIRQADAYCISYLLSEGISDKELAETLHPSVLEPIYKMPNYEHVRRELKRSGVA